MITNVGKKIQMYLLKGDTTTMGYPTHCAIGVGTNAEAVTDVSLQSEVYRVGFLSGYPSLDLTNFRVTYRAQFNITASYNITEIGLFTAATGGNLFNRKVFGAIPVANGDTLTFDIVIQYCPAKEDVEIISIKPNNKGGRDIHAVVYERMECND